MRYGLVEVKQPKKPKEVKVESTPEEPKIKRLTYSK